MCIDNKYVDIAAGNMTIMYIYKYDKYINSDIIFGCKCPIFVYKCLIFGYKHPNKVYRLDRVCLHEMVM